MWCGFEKSSVTIAAICMVTASVTISDTVFAASQVNYTPQQFRSVLRGLGYKVKVTNTPLTDDETKKAIQAFQKGYKLTADGIAGEKTQNLAGHIIQILQANLNVVLKPKSPLPRDQFYGPQTEAAVKEFQRKFQLKETGIADLTLRHKLNEEAKKVVSQPSNAPTPEPTVKPTGKPTVKPRVKPRVKPTATPTATPTDTPTDTPTATPTP